MACLKCSRPIPVKMKKKWTDMLFIRQRQFVFKTFGSQRCGVFPIIVLLHQPGALPLEVMY